MSELEFIAGVLLKEAAGFGKAEFEKLLAATCSKGGIVGGVECVLLNGTGRAIEQLVNESISELANGTFSADELWGMLRQRLDSPACSLRAHGARSRLSCGRAAVLGSLVLLCPTFAQALAGSVTNARRNFVRGQRLAILLAALWMAGVLSLRNHTAPFRHKSGLKGPKPDALQAAIRENGWEVGHVPAPYQPWQPMTRQTYAKCLAFVERCRRAAPPEAAEAAEEGEAAAAIKPPAVVVCCTRDMYLSGAFAVRYAIEELGYELEC